MPSQAQPPTGRGRARRRISAAGAALALLVLPAACCTGCGDEMSREFRTAAMGSIESGVNSIIDGILDGIFTLATPDGESASGS